MVKTVLSNTISIKIIFFFFFLCSCSNKFDGKNGIKTIFFPGTEKVQHIVEYKNGKIDGLMKEFYRNGNSKSIQHFVNDQFTDTSFFFHENGNLSSVKIKINNKKEGCWKQYNDKGKVYKETSYKDDLLDGPSTKYTYRSGRILQRSNFKEGEKDGKQEDYYNNGKIKTVLYYKNNNPCMGTEEWYESGEKVNNDFKITVVEQNRVLLENSLKFFIQLENPQKDDMVFFVSQKDTGRAVTIVYHLKKLGNQFLLEYSIGKGGFIMEKVKLAAFRKTKNGNVTIKTTEFNASANNY